MIDQHPAAGPERRRSHRAGWTGAPALVLLVALVVAWPGDSHSRSSSTTPDHPLFSIDCQPDAVSDPAARLVELDGWRADANPDRPHLHARWLFCRASALEMSGELDRAREAYTDSIAAHERLDSPLPDHVEAYLGRSYVDYLQTNDPGRYCPDRETALEIARELGDPPTLIMALNRAAFCYDARPEQLTRGLELLEEALELARREGLEPGERGMLHNATANLFRRNQLLAPALDSLEQAYRAWAEEDDRQDMFNMLHGLIQANVQLGRWDDAIRHLETMQALTDRSPGFEDFPFFVEFNAGTIEFERGNFDSAVEALERALALEATTQERYFVAAAGQMLAMAQFRVGNLEAAEQQARTFLATTDVGRRNPELLTAQAIVAFADGRPLVAMQALLSTLDAERAATRDRMQRNTAGQAAVHNRRLEAFESEILRERLTNRELQLVQSRQAERNARLVTLLAAVATAALLGLTAFLFWSRRRFRKHARTDGLTGIANRRYAMAQAEHLFGQARSSNRPFSLLLLDIDHFKRINDRYGHDAGDLAIRGLVDTVAAALPRDAVFGRLGGEEFMVATPDRSHAEALALAESIRQRVASQPIDVDGIGVELTVSIGVAERADSTSRLDLLYRAADQALYAAKRQGRDRIAAADT